MIDSFHQTSSRIIPGTKYAFLLCHGILGTPHFFDFLLPFIPSNCSYINLLLKGHGEGVKEFGRSSMEEWEKQIEETITYLRSLNLKIIMVTHSMGGLFALNEAYKNKDIFYRLVIFNPPLKIFVKPKAIFSSLEATFINEPKSINAKEMKKSSSVKLSKNPFLYLLWLPRYYELFKKSHDVRKIVRFIEVKTDVFISKKDELVSIKSANYFGKNENVKLHYLLDSGHHLYSEKDKDKAKDIFIELVNTLN